MRPDTNSFPLIMTSNTNLLKIAMGCALILAACTEHAPQPAPAPTQETVPVVDLLAPYRTLVGSWQDETSDPRFECYEMWRPEGDSAIIGQGFVMAKGDTVFYEELRIHVVEGEVTYSARIESQNEGQWVPFAAQAPVGDSLIFENPGHDFPQCITYVRDSSGVWEVAVSGNENGTERVEHFRFAPRAVQPM